MTTHGRRERGTAAHAPATCDRPARFGKAPFSWVIGATLGAGFYAAITMLRPSAVPTPATTGETSTVEVVALPQD